MPNLPLNRILSGASSACTHGLGLRRDFEEITMPPTSGVRSRRGLVVRHADLPESDIVTIRGFRVTSIQRTLRDLCVSEPAVEALVYIDAAIRLGRTTKAALERYAAETAGLPGARRLRQLVKLAAPAESPMETRLRWVLIQAKLPTPEVQVDLYD